MNNCCPPARFQRSVLTLAVCAACLPVQAQTEKTEAAPEEIRIEQASVSAGIGAASGSSDDRALFGQYNGMRSRGTVGILGFDYRLRDDANANWLLIEGASLLEETRELSLVWRNPGQWKFSANYGELVRYDPNTINTGLIGAGTTTPQVVRLPGGPGTGTDLELKTKRAALGLGLGTWLTPSLQFQFDVKSENKDGSRLFGVGMNCPSSAAPGCLGTTGVNTGWAVLMLPEPINANHSQIEARLSYAGEQLRVSLGYYGSFYRNNNSTLNPLVPAVLNNPLGNPLPLNTGLQALLSQAVALPPDNQAHQIDVSGSFDFTGTTRATFKLGLASATQNENFANDGLSGAPAGSPSLRGNYATTLGQMGITSRPIPQLSLVADYRFEDRRDNTPIALYNTEGTATYTNRALPYLNQRGKLEASWQFSSDYRGTLGADFENIDRGVFTATSAVSGISALRQKTDETTLRAELRRRMSEDFSGAIRVSSSRRDGSNWLKDNSGTGVTEVTDPATAFLPTAIFMPTLADRQRDKIKLFADWQPSESLSLQFSAEQGQDKFTAPSTYALQKTRMSHFSLDAGYALSDTWALNGYASYGQQTFNQSRPAGYVMAFENTNIGAGVGITGKPNSKLELGASLSYVDEKSVYAQTLDTFAGADSAALLAATGGLPDVLFRQSVLKLFGTYALEKQSSLRVDLNYYRSKTNDWAWGYNGVPFTYSDGTTVRQQQNQNVAFIGVTYNYQWK